jgi:hypothetical protein
VSDEKLFGSADGKHRSDKHELRRLLVRPDARLRLRLLLRAELQLLREIVLLWAKLRLRTELWLQQLLQWRWLLHPWSSLRCLPQPGLWQLLRAKLLLRTELRLRTELWLRTELRLQQLRFGLRLQSFVLLAG